MAMTYETDLRWIYERMSLIRQFEERVKWLVETGAPLGPVHFYIGQEAVAVGVCAALEEEDWIASTHRGHGHCIAKGVDVAAMMAELFGKTTGTNRGKGGSMHITDSQRGILGVNPIVGAGVAHALGAGLSAKVRRTKQVAVAFFGEGAAGLGTLHECLNMAAIWKLPVLFVCENNGYSQSTPFEYACPIQSVADRAAAYGMPGVRVDGQDVFAVLEATRSAVERARSGQGPSLIECMTYRYLGHHQSDDTSKYRLPEEESAARNNDCLRRFREEVLTDGRLTRENLECIDHEIGERLDEAVEFAKKGRVPAASELTTDVWVTAQGAEA